MNNPYLVQPSPKHHIQVSPTQSLTFWVTGADTENTFTYLEATLGYLDGPPLHLHTLEDEWLHVLEGTLRCQIGEELFDLAAGQMVNLPRGVPHTFANLQSEPVRLLGIVNNDFYSFYSDLMQAFRTDPATANEISTRYGNKTIGPTLPVILGLVKSGEPI